MGRAVVWPNTFPKTSVMGVKGKGKRRAGALSGGESTGNTPQTSPKKQKPEIDVPAKATQSTTKTTPRRPRNEIVTHTKLSSPEHAKPKDKRPISKGRAGTSVTSPQKTPQPRSQQSTPAKSPKTAKEASEQGIDNESAKTVLKGGQKWKTLLPMLHNTAKLTYDLEEFPTVENFGPVIVELARSMVNPLSY